MIRRRKRAKKTWGWNWRRNESDKRGGYLMEFIEVRIVVRRLIANKEEILKTEKLNRVLEVRVSFYHFFVFCLIGFFGLKISPKCILKHCMLI